MSKQFKDQLVYLTLQVTQTNQSFWDLIERRRPDPKIATWSKQKQASFRKENDLANIKCYQAEKALNQFYQEADISDLAILYDHKYPLAN